MSTVNLWVYGVNPVAESCPLPVHQQFRDTNKFPLLHGIKGNRMKKLNIVAPCCYCSSLIFFHPFYSHVHPPPSICTCLQLFFFFYGEVNDNNNESGRGIIFIELINFDELIPDKYLFLLIIPIIFTD